MSRVSFIRAVFTTALFCCASPARAQGTFAGAWTIAEWSVAPWVSDAERARIKPNANVLNHSLIFTAKHVVGPDLLSCDTPKYETVSSPFEGLFEGGLLKPKTDGPALGFKAPVKTLRPACDFDFHLKDPNTAMFALDNVLYTMKRKNPTPG